MKRKIIINFCPTGMVPTRAMNPNVAISVHEIVEQTHEAFELGITIAHLHARADDESATWEPGIYQRIFEGVRAHCPGLVICGSSSGRNVQEFEKRSAVIELKPDMCSLTLSSLNFIESASLNSPHMIKDLAEKMLLHGVHPELECFDMGMINYGKYLIAKGLLKGPFYWNLLFGNIAGMQATLDQIGAAVREVEGPSHYFALAGLGQDQLKVNSLSVSMGYGLRVGLEDNLWFDAGRTQKASNAGLLKRVHEMMQVLDASLYTSTELGKQGFYNGW